MVREAMKNSGLGGRMVFFLFVTLVSGAASVGLAIGLGRLMWGSGFMDMVNSSDFGLPRVVAAQLWFQGMSTLGIFIVPALWFAWLVDANFAGYLGLREGAAARSYWWAVILMVGSVPLIAYIYELNKSIVFPAGLDASLRELEMRAELITNGFLSQRGLLFLFGNLLVMSALPAIGEELFFRGVLQQQLGGWLRNRHVTVVITAFIFSAIHLQFFGFFPRFVLGLFLGYLFDWSKSLSLSIVAHFANNAFAVLVKYFSGEVSPMNAQKLNFLEESNLKFAFFSTMLISVMLYGIYQNEKKRIDSKNLPEN